MLKKTITKPITEEKPTLLEGAISKLLNNPTVTDKNLEKLIRENTREKIANKLIWLIGLLYAGFLIIGGILVFTLKITFRDMLDLILVLGALSGLLGTAINFYYKE